VTVEIMASLVSKPVSIFRCLTSSHGAPYTRADTVVLGPSPPPPRPSPPRGEGVISPLPPCGGGLGWGVFSLGQTAISTLLILILSAPALAGDPLRVEARIPKSVYYAGQAIEVRVGMVAEGERPTVTPPRIDGTAIVATGTDFKPVGASGIGDVVTETNLFVSKFHLIANRPGPLVIPPFLARLGDRAGSSQPIRLTIRAVPPEGRPPSYLRGVGRLEARADAVPASVRVGQAFEYRLILKGPGARGSTQVPLLPELEALKGIAFEPSGTDLIADPPLRTFRFRARAPAAGDFTLPSVAVSTFDPDMQRYVETRAPSIKLRVVEVPRFDDATLATITDETPSGPRIGGPLVLIPSALVLSAWTLLILVRRRTSARRWARSVAASLRPSHATDVAARVASGLTTYLARSIGRPGGELTPDEAERGIAQAVADPSLAARARRLIEHCDRARFGDATTDAGLAQEAVAFFEELATRSVER
jgi:hypothetical protein